jgi:CheY-like chemotaxis protein
MSTSILLQIEDQALADKLKGFLQGERYQTLTPGPPLGWESGTPESLLSVLTQGILEASPDIVVMDYLADDALSVKVMQAVTDQLPGTAFVFLDSRGQAEREHVILSFNEGVRGFLAPGVSKTAFLTAMARASSGPSRSRTGEDSHDLELEIQRQGQAISKLKQRLNAAQKLANYLLSTPVSSQPRKVIILSDSGYQREILKKLMEDVNFVVTVATSFEDAVAATLKERPRIVLCDYSLEDGKTGVDLCRELKFAQKITPLYFVVCTASIDKLPVVMAPGNGVDDCLLKPASDSQVPEFITRIALGLIL